MWAGGFFARPSSRATRLDEEREEAASSSMKGPKIGHAPFLRLHQHLQLQLRDPAIQTSLLVLPPTWSAGLCPFMVLWAMDGMCGIAISISIHPSSISRGVNQPGRQATFATATSGVGWWAVCAAAYS